MRYAYYDLGQQREGKTLRVHLRGSSANVMLLDPQNYSWYRSGRPFSYVGGLRRQTPVELTIPQDGHWYLVVDLGGYGGRVKAAVEMLDDEGSSAEHEFEESNGEPAPSTG